MKGCECYSPKEVVPTSGSPETPASIDYAQELHTVIQSHQMIQDWELIVHDLFFTILLFKVPLKVKAFILSEFLV